MYRVLTPQVRHSATTRQQVLRAAQERVSLRGIERIFGVSRQTVARWIRQHVWHLPVVVDTLLDYEVGDVLEMDELWSFVLNKGQKRWVWLALCRRTRQIVAFYIGKRDAHAAQQLWQRIDYPYTLCPLYTDTYEAYQAALPERQHWPKAKRSGATAHIERWKQHPSPAFGTTCQENLVLF